MPTVNVLKNNLFAALGRSYTDDEFADLCFAFGLELDDITSERKMLSKELGQDVDASDEVIYKVEIPANRYDLLCTEGLVRGLQVFNGVMSPPRYTTLPHREETTVTVKRETNPLRPFVVCAVLRDMKFDQETYKSFIDLQEKLHQNICRKRTLVSIGTHDLDTLKGPFTYECVEASHIEFIPLKQSKVFKADELMDYYLKNDTKLKQYVPILTNSGSSKYPVFYDSRKIVMSLPPIINGEHSKVTLNTRNVFIEVTATDLTKANVVLNTVVAMFSQYCANPFSAEQVKVVYEWQESDNTHITPDLSTYSLDCSTSYINSVTGLKLQADEIIKYLQRMQLQAEYLENSKDGKNLRVHVPVTRSDVLHECDVMEDVAIAYGYNNLPIEGPKTVTIGRQQPLNKLGDLLRLELAMAGFSEVLTLTLCSHDENFTFLGKEEGVNSELAVSLANPKTLEFQVCRTSLVPGVLKTLFHNQDASQPIKLFEVSDVILQDSSRDTGVRNERRLVALFSSSSSGLEVVHGLLDRVMQVLNVAYKEDAENNNSHPSSGSGSGNNTGSYHLEPAHHKMLLEGRQAAVFLNGKEIGFFGVVNPVTLGHFKIPYPTSILELQIEHFL